MPDAWEELIGGSTIQFGDAWEHLLAQGGEGGGDTIIIGGDTTVDSIFSSIAETGDSLSVDYILVTNDIDCGSSLSTVSDYDLSIEVDI